MILVNNIAISKEWDSMFRDESKTFFGTTELRIHDQRQLAEVISGKKTFLFCNCKHSVVFSTLLSYIPPTQLWFRLGCDLSLRG